MVGRKSDISWGISIDLVRFVKKVLTKVSARMVESRTGYSIESLLKTTYLFADHRSLL